MVTQKSCEPKVEIVQYSQGIRTHTEVSDSALHFAIFPGGPGVWLQANCNVLQKQLVPPIWNPEWGGPAPPAAASIFKAN